MFIAVTVARRRIPRGSSDSNYRLIGRQKSVDLGSEWFSMFIAVTVAGRRIPRGSSDSNYRLIGCQKSVDLGMCQLVVTDGFTPFRYNFSDYPLSYTLLVSLF